MNTKDLFELADIYHAETSKHVDPDEYTVDDWSELSPLEQAAKAEGIRAVVEELVSRGWGYYPQKIMTGLDPVVVTENALKDTAPWYFPRTITFPSFDYGSILRDGSLVIDKPGSVPDLPKALEKIEELVEAAEKLTAPRRWSRIEDVPMDIAVTDDDGDRWEFRDGVWGFVEDDGDFDPHWTNRNEYAPFTEVVKPSDPAPIELADWEKALVNPDGPWDRWEDVPDGVKYFGLNDKTEPAESYENHNGVQWNVTNGVGDEFKSVYSDGGMDTVSPFKRVG